MNSVDLVMWTCAELPGLSSLEAGNYIKQIFILTLQLPLCSFEPINSPQVSKSWQSVSRGACVCTEWFVVEVAAALAPDSWPAECTPH